MLEKDLGLGESLELQSQEVTHDLWKRNLGQMLGHKLDGEAA